MTCIFNDSYNCDQCHQWLISIADKDFSYIVDSQPIGECLFKLFCQKTIELMFCMEFLQALVSCQACDCHIVCVSFNLLRFLTFLILDIGDQIKHNQATEFIVPQNNFHMMAVDKHNETAKKIYAEFIRSDVSVCWCAHIHVVFWWKGLKYKLPSYCPFKFTLLKYTQLLKCERRNVGSANTWVVLQGLPVIKSLQGGPTIL